MTVALSHKRGDTLEFICTLSENSVVQDITSWTITCDLKREDVLTQELTVTKTDPTNGQFTISATAAQTANWQIGQHQADIEFIDTASFVVSTETFIVNVEKDITV
jgi:hypothetical protein